MKRRTDIPMQASTRGEDCCNERPSDEYIIRELFTYHPPNVMQQKAYENLRSAAKHMAEVILNTVPSGADRTAAIRKLREAIMTANAGIALRGLSL
jgi:hypothetical protein